VWTSWEFRKLHYTLLVWVNIGGIAVSEHKEVPPYKLHSRSGKKELATQWGQKYYHYLLRS
jgi:hypothetical protein